MSAQSLQAYSLGLVAFMLIKVLAPGYFSRQDTKTPVKVAIIAMATNMVFNLLLVFPLQHAGLALATTLSAFLNAGLLFRGLQKSAIYIPTTGWLIFFIRLVAANTAMAATLLWLSADIEQWLNWPMWEKISQASTLVGSGIVVYGISLLICGLRPKHLKH